jgi:hypothetical protein
MRASIAYTAGGYDFDIAKCDIKRIWRVVEVVET